MTDQKKKECVTETDFCEKEVGFVKRNLNGYTKNGALRAQRLEGGPEWL